MAKGPLSELVERVREAVFDDEDLRADLLDTLEPLARAQANRAAAAAKAREERSKMKRDAARATAIALLSERPGLSSRELTAIIHRRTRHEVSLRVIRSEAKKLIKEKEMVVSLPKRPSTCCTVNESTST